MYVNQKRKAISIRCIQCDANLNKIQMDMGHNKCSNCQEESFKFNKKLGLYDKNSLIEFGIYIKRIYKLFLGLLK